MLSIDRSILRQCLRQIAKALIKFSLKHSIKIQDLEEILRAQYLEQAREEILRKGEKISDSRLSIVTGLSRREVQKRESGQKGKDEQIDLVMRVIALWQTHPRFIGRDKTPKVLSSGFDNSDFNSLVNMVSTDLNPATILFELERVSAVKREAEGLKLLVQAYVPKGNVEAMFSVLSDDMADLIDSVEENVFFQPAISNLHLRTSYDRIRSEGIMELKQWLLKEGHAFHAKARQKIAEYDQDVNPDLNYCGKFSRIVLGSFGKVFENVSKAKEEL